MGVMSVELKSRIIRRLVQEEAMRLEEMKLSQVRARIREVACQELSLEVYTAMLSRLLAESTEVVSAVKP